MPQVVPPLWAIDRLQTERQASIDAFRHERVGEPLERYLVYFKAAREAVETILEMTVDLLRVREDLGRGDRPGRPSLVFRRLPRRRLPVRVRVGVVVGARGGRRVPAVYATGLGASFSGR
jgi:hypothetical protein